MNILVVVDMQNDFVTGALGTPEAQAIVPAVVERVEDAFLDGEHVIFTRDTHGENYMDTLEGKNLPVPHCIRDTEGWQLVPELNRLAKGCTIIDKPTFGSTELGDMLAEMNSDIEVEQITFIGVCTDICVISNAMIAKAACPETEIIIESDCCAGVTPESHENALNAMEACQMTIVEYVEEDGGLDE